MPLYLALNIPLNNEFDYSGKYWKLTVGQAEEVRSWRPGRSWITQNYEVVYVIEIKIQSLRHHKNFHTRNHILKQLFQKLAVQHYCLGI